MVSVTFDDGSKLTLRKSRVVHEAPEAGLEKEDDDSSDNDDDDDDEVPGDHDDEEDVEAADVDSAAAADAEENAAAVNNEGGSPSDKHAAKAAAADTVIAAKLGEVVEKSGTILGKNVTAKWTVVAPHSVRKDDHPDLHGPTGSTAKLPLQYDVVKGFNVRESTTPELDLFLELLPTPLPEFIGLVNEAGARAATGKKWLDVTKREMLVWFGLFLAAPLHHERGRSLWATQAETYTGPPNFGQHMVRDRFKAIKAVISHTMADRSVEHTDEWWRARRFITDFNKNRLLKIHKTRRVLMDVVDLEKGVES